MPSFEFMSDLVLTNTARHAALGDCFDAPFGASAIQPRDYVAFAEGLLALSASTVTESAEYVISREANKTSVPVPREPNLSTALVTAQQSGLGLCGTASSLTLHTSAEFRWTTQYAGSKQRGTFGGVETSANHRPHSTLAQ
ncbi:hypothetical protein NPX13_g2918 [Xylaria arbuscula]|uniref:Uncharacterized protein n=1 Tax=Xylaria arbuscula TaxID=114810 RepID=A0A9W8TQM6_9PEZI|nr:hypothetical protein NPX13_g2918 [Xylaria arbuscula]